jgi:hypothetical protein
VRVDGLDGSVFLILLVLRGQVDGHLLLSRDHGLDGTFRREDGRDLALERSLGGASRHGHGRDERDEDREAGIAFLHSVEPPGASSPGVDKTIPRLFHICKEQIGP